MQFRPYQQSIIGQGSKILNRYKILMLAMEVRTGKTLTALGIANEIGSSNVLFITKKKAISSIQDDYNLFKPNYSIKVINYESLHKVNAKDFDLVIIDESHSISAFPKPSARTRNVKKIVGKKKVILLSGTPTPESFSQIYHQFWISEFNPFEENTFYKWAKNYVNITSKKINGYNVNDYTKANENLIRQKTSKYIISFTQVQAGFKSKVNEHILTVPMKPITYNLIKKVEKDLVYTGKNGGVILADTPVKLLQKVHQLYSGTVKLEDGSAISLDDSKAKFINKRFRGTKIGIFYKYKQELNLLQEVYGNSLTTDLTEFNSTDKSIALQIVSGREGISLKKAANLVFFNIDYSATSYWQSRDRLTTKERSINDIYWVFAENGIEHKIYEKVLEKKSFTTKHYEKVNTN